MVIMLASIVVDLELDPGAGQIKDYTICICCFSAKHTALSKIYGPGWLNELDLTTHTSLSPICRVFAPGFVNYKKGALDSQPQVIKFTSCFPMVGGSLRVLRLPAPLKLVAMI